MAASLPSKPVFTVSVRSLVEHLLRGGDIRRDFLGSVRAVEGIRAHQQIQGQREPEYQAEVSVAYEIDGPEFNLKVTGRIDGVLDQGQDVVVEEIKSTRRSLNELEASPNPIHWGQAKCYAYMWASQENLERVVVRMTYMHMDSGRIREIERRMETAELKSFFEALVGRYIHWISQLAQWGAVREASIGRLDFPYPDYRKGQRDMAVAVYRNIRNGGHLLLQAATGIGKTMGAIFPAIKALGEGLSEKIVFLTARTTGRLAAESALEKLGRTGLRIKSLTITAKDKVCIDPENECLPEVCDRAKGHFDRINDAISATLLYDAITRDRVETIAGNHLVCPFELSLELVNWVDCVICDYNYAFAPGVLLQRLFGEEGGSHAVLVDEAHNLVDRSRDMFSAQLFKASVLALRRSLKDELPKLFRCLGRMNAWMATMRRKCRQASGPIVEKTISPALIQRLKEFIWQAEKWLALNLRTEFRENLIDLFFQVARFLKISESFGPSYVVIYEAEDDELSIKLYCLDPSEQLNAAWSGCQSAVLFSATLAPVGYFQTVLGCRADAAALNIPSPFPPSNLAVFVADRISTLYHSREETCGQVVRAICALVGRRKGHYLLFLPSYQYMRMVHQAFTSRSNDVDVLVQTAEMTEEQREAFLGRFKERVTRTLVGFAVMGGIFGEGIDLLGERLAGAVVVGVGLPGISIEKDLIRDYFDRKNNFGFEFAYQFPGINRVLQAAGRVIRSEKDRGVVLLVDRRYNERRYRKLLPSTWQLTRIDEIKNFEYEIDAFWDSIG